LSPVRIQMLIFPQCSERASIAGTTHEMWLWKLCTGKCRCYHCCRYSCYRYWCTRKVTYFDCLIPWLLSQKARLNGHCNTVRQHWNNSVAFIPLANSTDWATATCWRILVPTFVDRGVSRGLRGGSPAVANLRVLTGANTFLSCNSSFNLTRAEWTPFQTHCYSENLVAPGIELGTSGFAAKNPNSEAQA
jgi:hypothetical protein